MYRHFHGCAHPAARTGNPQASANFQRYATSAGTRSGGTLRTGVIVAASPGVENLAVQAEELGLSSFWVYDTPMVHGDPFTALALCAKATSRIKLGVGVTSPALRSIPATASAFASLNALAPGRIICGVGTGNSARRTLGMPPTKAAELETFTASLQDLTAGHSISYREGEQVRDVQFLHADPQQHATEPIEFVVAAQGLKAAAIAGRRGTGLMSFAIPNPETWHAFRGARQDAAQAASIPVDGASYLITSLHTLGQSEDPYGDAVRDATGHTVLSFLVFAADKPSFAELLGPEEREAVQRFLDRRATTGTAPDRYRRLYPNYLNRIDPADRDLVLPSLVDKLALVGTRDSLRRRLALLEAAGVDELVIQPVVDPPRELAALVKLTT
ncbi:LLM class flavin-dependent oxidoreductase [Kribbella albertanoniae]|uniref:LLM class flavin-dependent oxidoreductase n=1 Tax=Kribbella albertanoniae TaxID=1266829 RepID=A0A4R4NXD6_9ACTN|nr:LLM class flavin-dependent oxidoreductase [Kribbella albertanoniae]